MSHITDSLEVEKVLDHNGWRQGLIPLTVANSTLTLTVDSTHVMYFTGTTAGQIVRLPSALTLKPGQRFDFWNTSTQQITIQDSTGAFLFTAFPDYNLQAQLLSAATAAGIWGIRSSGIGTASGIINYKIVSSTSFSPGTGDTVVSGMSVVPVQGTYAIWYHGSCLITGNNTILTTSVFNGATQITDSIRVIGSSVSTFRTNHASQTTAQFNGTDACSVHVSRTGNAFTVTGRSLILIRMGD